MNSYIAVNPSNYSDMPFFLPSPQPIGGLNEKAEGLSSYIQRLCCFNKVTPYQVFGCLTRNFTELIGLKYSSIWVNINGTYNNAIFMLQSLTKRNLELLTAKSIIEFFNNEKIIRKNQAWCPKCYNEWKNSGTTLYQPLMWSFSNIKYCVLHKTELVEKCPNCQAYLPLVPRKTNIGYCPQCLEWLGRWDYEGKIVDENFFKFQEWSTNNLGALMADSNKMSSWDLFEINAQWLAPKGGPWQKSLVAWTHKETRPELSALLLLSYQMKIPLLDMLRKELRYEQLHLPHYEEMTRPVRRQKLNCLAIEKALHEIIDSNEEPFPNLEEVASRLNCSTFPLVTRWPDLCKIIRAQHRLYLTKVKVRKIEMMKDVAKALVREGLAPTFTNIKSRMPEGFFNKPEISWSMWEKVSMELDYSSVHISSA